jgi:hypothetical protein
LPLLLKALPAEDRSPLCGLERDGGLLTALRASRSSFGLGGRLSWDGRSQNRNALRLACFTTFGFVLELLVVKEQLFACGKNKVRAAVDALQYLVLEVHPSPHSPDASRSFSEVGNFRTCERAQSRYAPPLNYPWIRPTCSDAGLLQKN